ncbi:hypothetical protein AAFF_G00207530 [Aldrovandia affinis]|uniref:Gastric inhibitory polypeptide n=1 Tax=Aldrovandia affinis TaxID=143900 RepID=A0AAD7RHL7_9TELE|nr:hypothetical protein AAFF_G00207530 [Aldrovandia affinis]
MPMVLAGGKVEESSPSDDGRGQSRRYAESTIASDMSKLVDSMVQKNFVNFLLTQREKKSEPNRSLRAPEEPEIQLLNELLEREFAQWIRTKGNKVKVQ